MSGEGTNLGNFKLQIHCVWAAAEAYSAPSIVLTSHTADGLHVFDDFREAYAWLSHNTDENDKVGECSTTSFDLEINCVCLSTSFQMRACIWKWDCYILYYLTLQVASWWDYGYQTTAMANRTVIVDNNTWNNTHIATVGMAMSSPERQAWEIYQSLDVKYVFVVFGGLVGYPSDDINKFLWMVRIGGGVFPHIKEPDYLVSETFPAPKYAWRFQWLTLMILDESLWCGEDPSLVTHIGKWARVMPVMWSGVYLAQFLDCFWTNYSGLIWLSGSNTLHHVVLQFLVF